jgi:para-nitrobenzyl esterase
MQVAGAGRRRSRALRAMDAEKLTDGALKARASGPWARSTARCCPSQLVDTFDRGEQAPVPILAGFNSGEIRSLRMLAPPPPADAPPMRDDPCPLWRPRRRLPQALSLGTIAESMLATTRDALYGWTAERLAIKQTALGQPAISICSTMAIRPRTTTGCMPSMPRAALCVRHGGRDAAYWPKVPDTLAERRLSDAMGLLDVLREDRRAGREGPARMAALWQGRAITWRSPHPQPGGS